MLIYFRFRTMCSRIFVVLGLILGVIYFGRAGSLCSEVTDIIILLESKNVTQRQATHEADRQSPFNRHRVTALSLIHRLPMSQGNVRVTVAQFNNIKSKIEVIYDKPGSSKVQGSDIRKQKKSQILKEVENMIPIETKEKTQHGGNLLGAFKLVSDVIIPEILRSDKNRVITQNPKSKIILVTILSGYWSRPNIQKLAAVFVRLSKQGVLSYIAAYDMKNHPSQSILPLVVSKKEFLILPKLYQSNAVAGHLADAFQVCWKDGPCWPYNPCLFGCDCIENSNNANGYECISKNPNWLDKKCSIPSAMLTCLPNRMELRLPKHYVTKSITHRKETVVFMGLGETWPSSKFDHECVATVIEQKTKDKGSNPQSEAILESEGFYYLISVNIMENKCLSVLSTNEKKKTLTFSNTIFKSRSTLPRGVRMDVPVVNVQCVYAANVTTVRKLPPASPVGRSARNHKSPADQTQNDEAQAPGGILSRTILLNGHKFNYDDWKRKNPFQDPDETFNLIQEHGGIANIIANAITGKYSVIDEIDETQEHNLRQSFASEPRYDDSSLSLVPDINQGGSFNQPRPRNPIAYQPPPGCHSGPYEDGDMCNPIYHTKALPTTQAETTRPAHTTVGTTQRETTLEPITTIKPTTQALNTTHILTTQELTTVIELTTERPTTIHPTTEVVTTTAKPTTYIPTTIVQRTTQAPTTQEPTTTCRMTTQQPTTTPQVTTKEPTTTGAITTKRPTTTLPITTQEPTTSHEISTLEPTTTQKITTQEPTTTYAITTQELTTTFKITTQKPTTSYAITTQEPTTTQKITNRKPTTTYAFTTPEPTTTLKITTPQPTTKHVITTAEATSTRQITTKKLTTSQKMTTIGITSQESTTKPTTGQLSTTNVLVTSRAQTTALVTTLHPTTIYNSIIKIKFYQDKSLTREVGPGSASVGSKVYVYVGPDKNSSPTPGVCPYVRVCWMNIGKNETNQTKLTMLDDGCPVEPNPAGVVMLSNGKSRSSVFSFQSIKYNFVPDNAAYYIQCNITICDCSLTGCAKRFSFAWKLFVNGVKFLAQTEPLLFINYSYLTQYCCRLLFDVYLAKGVYKGFLVGKLRWQISPIKRPSQYFHNLQDCGVVNSRSRRSLPKADMFSKLHSLTSKNKDD